MRLASVTTALLLAHVLGCARRVSFEVVDARTHQRLDRVSVYQYFGPGDPMRAVPVAFPVATTKANGKFKTVLNEGLINTFEFRRPGYQTMVAVAEYHYDQVRLSCPEGEPGQYTDADRTKPVIVPMPRVPTSQPGAVR